MIMQILFSDELILLLISSFLIELRIFSSINNDILSQLSGFYVLLIDWFQILQQNCKAPFNINFHLIKCIRSWTLSFKVFSLGASPRELGSSWSLGLYVPSFELGIFLMIPLYLHLHFISYTSLGFSGVLFLFGLVIELMFKCNYIFPLAVYLYLSVFQITFL